MTRQKQITHQRIMVRPARFGPNPETAASNAFQQSQLDLDAQTVRRKAIEEFDRAVDQLRDAGVDVMVVQDSPEPPKSDAVFPNNWISFHADGTVITYPMFAPSRRLEIRDDVIERIRQQFQVQRVWSLHDEVSSNRFLEGTGSLVLDHVHRIAYACRSVRTSAELVATFCDKMGFRPVLFHAADETGLPVYHTNVILALGTSFSVVCLESIRDGSERRLVERELTGSGKLMVVISFDQVKRFCGNLLQLARPEKPPLVVMSDSALRAFSEQQLAALSKESELMAISIPTIESYGGGSARCMMAENFLKRRSVE